MVGSIGIKQANGNFYPILEENSPGKKRIVLTTAHDNQKSVQVDLFKSNIKSMADAQYLGSIVVDNIVPRAKKVPSIEMIISTTIKGVLSISAVDLENPSNVHNLSISLDLLEDDDIIDYPDFETDFDAKKDRVKKSWSKKIQRDTPRRKKPIPDIAIILLSVALLGAGIWFVLSRGLITMPKLPAIFRVKTQTAAPPPEPAEPVIITSPLASLGISFNRERPPADAGSSIDPQAIPQEGFSYKVRPGDTLWDISQAFYRNPRFYSGIAQSNNITNPNNIISGTELIVDPRD